MHLFDAFLHEHTRWTICSGSTWITADGVVDESRMDDDDEPDEAFDDTADTAHPFPVPEDVECLDHDDA